MRIVGRPITKKNGRVNTGRGFTVASKAYRDWERDACWQLKSERAYDGKLSVNILFEMKGKLDADLDNLTTSVLDMLQKAGIIGDDKYVVEMKTIKKHGYKDWATNIEIEELK